MDVAELMSDVMVGALAGTAMGGARRLRSGQ